METHTFEFNYQIFEAKELPEYASLLYQESVKALSLSWSPYSTFQVGAAILLENGEVLRGANQENAAYPMCLCAERVVLATAASQFPRVSIKSMCVLARLGEQESLHPVSPCGACRQVLLETENKQNASISLYLGGTEEKLLHLANSSLLLPLAFGGLEANLFPNQK
ncbi:MAG: cytidine deaminase [Bacteroidota bacterium]